MGHDRNHVGQIEFDLFMNKREQRPKHGSYEVKIINISVNCMYVVEHDLIQI